MKNANQLFDGVFVAAMLAMLAPSYAQTTAASGASAQPPASAASCAGCHGARGEGNAASGFPRIAGQPAPYLARQLSSYANGRRNNQIMTPIAKGMTPQQIEEVSNYYAAQAAPSPKAAGKSNAKAIARGRLLANSGDEKKEIQSCANCHGPGGSGLPPNYPYLAGQYPNYLTAALAEWRKGARNTDPSRQMPSIAKKLNDSDIAAVTAYYSMQPAPRPAADRVSMPAGLATAGTQQAPGPSAAPPASAPAAQGAGVGQGEATSGGQQGPGGGGGTSEGGTKDNR